MPYSPRITFFPIMCMCLILNACRESGSRSTPTPIPETEEPVVSTPIPGQMVFYIAPNGKDSYPGTLDQPWASINHAAEVLNSGQTVYVRDGIYKLAQRIIVRNSGVENAWIR